MPSDLSIFILGATGYIGGAVAVKLREKYPSAEIVAYTRSAAKSEALEKAGLTPLAGSNSSWNVDQDAISAAISKADVVFNTADADDLPLTRLVLAALNNSSRKNPILIHTSGTGLLIAKGDYNGELAEHAKIPIEDSVEGIKSIIDTAPHRDVDLEIFKASQTTGLPAYILAPATIYGVAWRNPVHKISQQLPNLIRLSTKYKQAVYGGPGTNIWNNVSIHDMADLFILITEKALSEREAGKVDTSEPESRFYWVANGLHVWGDVSRALGPILHAKGLATTPEAKSVDPKELGPAINSNSHALATRAIRDGWKPKDGPLEQQYEKWLTQDVQAYIDGLFH